ncbi:T9SS type A sorting domain-containing protein [Dyadobacter endophyticus]|nr:T9SS type A sorting domain-containing protein [Dyadobacter endophyticus]
MKYLYALLLMALLGSCNNPPEVEPDPILTLVTYPNPAGKRIAFHVENDERAAFTLQIYDPKGKMVFEWQVPEGDATQGFNLDPTEFGTGAFHAVLRKNGSVYTKKFMVI